jgi:hypothetical protein
MSSHWTRTGHDLFSRAIPPDRYTTQEPLLAGLALSENERFNAEISEWCHRVRAGADGLRGREE